GAHERDRAHEVLVARRQVELGPIGFLQARIGEAGAEVVVVDEPRRAHVSAGLAWHGVAALADAEAQRRAEVAVHGEAEAAGEQPSLQSLEELLRPLEA